MSLLDPLLISDFIYSNVVTIYILHTHHASFINETVLF